MSDDEMPIDGEHCDFFSLNGNISNLKWKDRNGRKKCKPYIEITLRLDAETFFHNQDVRNLKGGLFLIAEKGTIKQESSIEITEEKDT